jgi:hypothetical protein
VASVPNMNPVTSPMVRGRHTIPRPPVAVSIAISSEWRRRHSPGRTRPLAPGFPRVTCGPRRSRRRTPRRTTRPRREPPQHWSVAR